MSGGNFLSSKKGKTVLGYAYAWGAAIVILGALFKIMHWKGASEMLIVGMGTEAAIFFLSAFEPVHMELDWTLVYPELKGSGADSSSKTKSKSVTEQLDDMLGKSKVGTELIDSLGKGMTNLSDTVGKMAKLGDASVATTEFSTNVKTAAGSVSAFNNITVEAGGKISEMTKAYGGVANSIATLNAAAADAEVYKNELSKLTGNLKNLNSIYGGMLSAMTGNNGK
jgi:hypothetical protein